MSERIHICEDGFTLILPAIQSRDTELEDIVFFGYSASDNNTTDFLVVSLNELKRHLRQNDVISVSRNCRELYSRLENLPKNIIMELFKKYLGTTKGRLDVGTTIPIVEVPPLCETLVELREFIRKSLCRYLQNCINDLLKSEKRERIAASRRLRVFYTAIGCNRNIVNPRLIAFSYTMTLSTGVTKALILVFPLASLTDVSGPAAEHPEVCRQCAGVGQPGHNVCGYSNIPVFYCMPDNRTVITFVAYPICELNNVNTPRCDQVSIMPVCPFKYMAEKVANGKTASLYVCRSGLFTRVLSPTNAWQHCGKHICSGRYSGTAECSEVYEYVIRTEPLLTKYQYQIISRIQDLACRRGIGAELTIARINLAYALNRFKLTIGGEEFRFKLPKNIYATVRDTLALIFWLSSSTVRDIVLQVAALGPQSLPMKTLAVKIAAVAFNEEPRLYYAVKNSVSSSGASKLPQLASWCVRVFQRVANRSFYYAYRPGLTGFRYLASLLLDDNTRRYTLQFLDHIARVVVSNYDTLIPYVVHSFAALLTSAIINMYNLPEEMVSTFVLYDSKQSKYSIVVYEDRDGGYGFLPSLTLDELSNAVQRISQIISARSHSYVLSARAQRGTATLNPVNTCDSQIINMLDKVSSDLVTWSGSQLQLTIVPAWLIKIALSYRFIANRVCKGSSPSDVRQAMQLVTERVAMFFDTDFHDTMFTVLGESVRIDLNDNAERLLTTNYIAPQLIRLLQSMKC